MTREGGGFNSGPYASPSTTQIRTRTRNSCRHSIFPSIQQCFSSYLRSAYPYQMPIINPEGRPDGQRPLVLDQGQYRAPTYFVTSHQSDFLPRLTRPPPAPLSRPHTVTSRPATGQPIQQRDIQKVSTVGVHHTFVCQKPPAPC